MAGCINMSWTDKQTNVKFQLKTMDRRTDIGLKIIINYTLLLIFKQFICIYISDVVLGIIFKLWYK